jgi:Protein of unknown function (DUF2937)
VQLSAPRCRSARVSFERLATLERQQRAMDAPDMLTRSLALLKDYDPMIAKGAWARFRPALPLTLEGAFAALTGFALFALIIGLLALPLGIGRKRVAPALEWKPGADALANIIPDLTIGLQPQFPRTA